VENDQDQAIAELIAHEKNLLSEYGNIKRKFFESSQFLKILLNTIPSPVFYKDSKGVYQNCNDAFANLILGIPKEKIINKSLLDLPDEIPVELAQTYMQADKKLFDHPGRQEYKAQVNCADQTIRTFMFYKSTMEDETGQVIGLVGIMLDISKLEKQNQHLELLSLTDALTGLFNRRKFDTTFPQLLSATSSNQSLLNFAIIDIDDFKKYNDKYGHPEGDFILTSVARIIQSRLLRSSDYAFRLGGEEYGILFYSNNEAEALKLTDKIRLDVENSYTRKNANKFQTSITISIGLVTIKSPENETDFIFLEADRLLYQAKNTGKNKIVSLLI